MPSTYLASVGNRVHAARSEARLTQRELAERTGLSERTIRRVERSTGNPTVDTALRLAQALDVSFQSFLVETTPEYEARARAERRRLGVA